MPEPDDDAAASMCATDGVYHPATDAPATHPVIQLITNADDVLRLRPTLEAPIRREEKDRLMLLLLLTNDDGSICLALLPLRATPRRCRPNRGALKLPLLVVRLWLYLYRYPFRRVGAALDAAVAPLAAAIMVKQILELAFFALAVFVFVE